MSVVDPGQVSYGEVQKGVLKPDPVFGRAMNMPVYWSGQLAGLVILLKVWETKASQSFG